MNSLVNVSIFALNHGIVGVWRAWKEGRWKKEVKFWLKWHNSQINSGGLCLRFHWAMVVLLWLLVLAPDFPLFDIASVKKESTVDSRSFQADTCCHVYFLFLFFF